MRAQTIRVLLAAGSGVAAGLVAHPALAYVGPGAGVSLIGAALGLIAAVFSVVGFILVWPIRALLKKRRAAATAKGPGGTAAGAEEASARDRGPVA